MTLSAANEAIALIHQFAGPIPRPPSPPVPRAGQRAPLGRRDPLPVEDRGSLPTGSDRTPRRSGARHRRAAAAALAAPAPRPLISCRFDVVP
jgi:hypothetical protein